MPAASYNSAFGEGTLHCRTEYMFPCFCENAVRMYSPFGKDSSRLNEEKNVSATALSSGLAVAEKDCFTPHCWNRAVNAYGTYWLPRSQWILTLYGAKNRNLNIYRIYVIFCMCLWMSKKKIVSALRKFFDTWKSSARIFRGKARRAVVNWIEAFITESA